MIVWKRRHCIQKKLTWCGFVDSRDRSLMADKIPLALTCVFRPDDRSQLCTRGADVLPIVAVVIAPSVSV